MFGVIYLFLFLSLGSRALLVGRALPLFMIIIKHCGPEAKPFFFFLILKYSLPSSQQHFLGNSIFILHALNMKCLYNGVMEADHNFS